MKDLLELYDTLRLVVHWHNMYTFCNERGKAVDGAKCKTCPYYVDNVCNKLSTKEVLSIAANVFAKYI